MEKNSLVRKGGYLVKSSHLLDQEKEKFCSSPDSETDQEVIRPEPYHYSIRNAMHYGFANQFGYFANFENFPVAKITYVVSLLIATLPEVRVKFFDNYDGPIPAITQYLINEFRIGVLKSGDILVDYHWRKEYFISITECELTNTFLNMTSNYDLQKNVPFIIAWLVLLNKLDHQSNNEKRYFTNYVKLDKVQLYSSELLSLPGLCIK